MTTGTRIRNVVFCAVCIVIFCAAILYKAADMTDTLPEELDNGKQSYLEGAALQPLPELSLTAFTSGDLQDEIEDYLSGCWPARDEALLANAALQRNLIQLAATSFHFDTWHTYYDSDQVYNSSSNALFEVPDAATNANAKTLESAAKAINSIQENHPDMRVVIYITDRSRLSNANPVQSLSNSAIDYEFIQAHFFELLNDDIEVLTDPLDTPTDFFAYYFKTDHHWNIHGAYQAYCKIAKTLDITPLEPTGEVEYPEHPFFGTLDRRGLYSSLSDTISDYLFDLPPLSTFRNNKPFERNHKTQYRTKDGLDANQAKYNAYEYYFGNDTDKVVYDNPEMDSGNCLMIGDSFMHPIEPLLASAFSKQTVIDPRLNKANLSTEIEASEADTLVMILGTNTLLNSAVVPYLNS